MAVMAFAFIPLASAGPPGHVTPIYYHLRGEDALHASADPELPESLLRRFMELHTAMDYVRAAEVALRLVELRPESPIAHYNLACVFARLHRLDESLDALERAIERGWRHAAHTRLDPDLHSLRWMPRYDALIDSLEAAAEAERIRPAPLRSDPWQDVAEELESLVPAMLERYHVPGATIALLRDGQLVWSAAFGRAEAHADGRGPDETAMREDHLVPVRGPLHLLALMGALQETPRGGERVAAVFRHARLEAYERRIRQVSRSSPPIRMTLSSASPSEPIRPRSIVVRASIEERRAPEPVFNALRLAAELSMNRGFADFCREHAFEPIGMRDTTFHLRESARERVVTGHTRLGTPAPTPAQRRGEVAYTTAGDLARLMEAIIAAQRAAGAEDAGPPLDRGARRLSLLPRLGASPADLAVEVASGRAGLRIDVSEQSGGVGCLMRLYPASGNAIVILYNSEAGDEAAARIAHAALGGP